MKLKKIVVQIHLWLGLASGLVVLIVALTGAIYCFAPEIENATQPYRFANGNVQTSLPISTIKQKAEKALGGNRKADHIGLFANNRSAVVSFFDDNMPDYVVFVNPYTGEVLHKQNMEQDFFNIVLEGHVSLWLPSKIGQTIVDISTLLFLFMLITGLILWWPANKARLKTSFKIKLNASPKRLNYDLHNVLGFYASWVIIFTVFSGLVWAFSWFANGSYWLMSGGESKPDSEDPVVVVYKRGIIPSTTDSIVQLALKKHPNFIQYNIIFPHEPEEPLAIMMNPHETKSYAIEEHDYNPYTGAEIPLVINPKHPKIIFADRIAKMNYDIHTGAIAGFVCRLFLFFACLIVASLPITGFYIWWGMGRRRGR